MNKYPEVLGTDNQDYFLVERLENGDTKVQGWADINGKKVQFFDRVFKYGITKEIRLFGQDKDDKFEVVGSAKKGIKVRLIGGFEEDEFIDKSKVSGLSKKTIINDEIGDNKLDVGKESSDRRSNLEALNNFTYLKQEIGYNYVTPTIAPGYNPDEGFTLGIGMDYFHHPYKRTNEHKFDVSCAFATQGIRASYEALFDKPFNSKKDVILKLLYSTPRFTMNYYGLGNSTGLPNRDRDFNRVRMSLFKVEPRIRAPIYEDNYFEYGPTLEGVKVEQTPDRIASFSGIGIPPSNFNWQLFAGLQARMKFDFVDRGLNPENGIRFNFVGSWKSNLTNTSRNFAQLSTDLSFYKSWNSERKLVYAGRFGYNHIFGAYDFFQAASLGANSGLRGFRQERFAGRSAIYLNNDLRLKLIEAKKTTIPFTMGITFGADIGRVYWEIEDNDDWHLGYGGSIWIAPVELVIFNIGYFRSNEDQRFNVRLGHAF